MAAGEGDDAALQGDDHASTVSQDQRRGQAEQV
jgi:hypothetical protein